MQIKAIRIYHYIPTRMAKFLSDGENVGWASLVAQALKNLPAIQEPWV